MYLYNDFVVEYKNKKILNGLQTCINLLRNELTIYDSLRTIKTNMNIITNDIKYIYIIV